mmetsp:Transcript_5108/g.11374  ORF Transcript_5108/g.11374 Transcript_5108/m.11374 type:complete len:266 (+) Transcript_5108:502-1299(+)
MHIRRPPESGQKTPVQPSSHRGVELKGHTGRTILPLVLGLVDKPGAKHHGVPGTQVDYVGGGPGAALVHGAVAEEEGRVGEATGVDQADAPAPVAAELQGHGGLDVGIHVGFGACSWSCEPELRGALLVSSAIGMHERGQLGQTVNLVQHRSGPVVLLPRPIVKLHVLDPPIIRSLLRGFRVLRSARGLDLVPVPAELGRRVGGVGGVGEAHGPALELGVPLKIVASPIVDIPKKVAHIAQHEHLALRHQPCEPVRGHVYTPVLP